MGAAETIAAVTKLFVVSFRTKIFIRFPKTLFATEDAFEFRKHLLGTVPLVEAWVSGVSGLWVHAADTPW